MIDATSPTVTSPTGALPTGLRLGPATLAVADRERSLAFYREFLGLTVLDEVPHDGEPAVMLGAQGVAVIRIVARPGIAPLPRRVTGLYHAAILLPDRAALGRVILRLAEARYPFGASDHAVSEALYLDDPDGNGLEIYADRDRSEWTWDGDRVRMTTVALDLDAVVAAIPDGSPRWAPMPAGTTLGHVHLRVGDAGAAERFYAGTVGFDVVASFPGATFMSVGGYHHHLGANSWETGGAPPRSDATAGLIEWEIVLPTVDDVAATAARLAAAGVTTGARSDGSFDIVDPWGTRLVFRSAYSS